MVDTSGTRWHGDADASLPVALQVLRNGPISRADIGRRLGLSHASLSRLSGPLLESGLIHDIGEHSSGRVGRPSRLLDVDATSHSFLGVKVREHELVAAVTDLRGEIIDHLTAPLTGTSPADVVERIAYVRDAFDRHTITGIGAGIGGEVIDRRVVSSAGFLCWQDVDFATMIERATGVPAIVENDVVALCEYEDWFGVARDDERFAVITVGIGTGFGLVVDGRPVVGPGYGLGLVGHWPMDPTGPLCAQGHRGCAAALLNSDAIARRAGEALGRDVSLDEVLDLAEEHDPAAERIVAEAAGGLGVLIAAVCNLTLPDRIIIAGEGVRLAAVGAEATRSSLAQHRDPRAPMPPLTLASGDNVEWARGAAVLAIQAFALGQFAPVDDAGGRA